MSCKFYVSLVVVLTPQITKKHLSNIKMFRRFGLVINGIHIVVNKTQSTAAVFIESCDSESVRVMVRCNRLTARLFSIKVNSICTHFLQSTTDVTPSVIKNHISGKLLFPPL